MTSPSWIVRALLLAAGLAVEPAAAAQSYPARTVRLIAPIAPGGATDVFARTLAAHYAEAWGQQVLVDNRPGAGGMIGSELVARAPPDGYTLLMAYTSHVINPSLWTRLPYDTLRDFAPVSMVAEVPAVLLVHPSLPVKSVPELIQFARRRPHELDYGSSGIATAAHLAAALLAQRAGLFLSHVPYKGGVPALHELIGGQISILFGSVATGLPALQAGRVRGLAVTSLKRSPVLPELPTVAEAALPGYEAIGWFALFAPAQTPAAVIHRIATDTLLMPGRREIRGRFLAHGAEFQPSAPEVLGDRVRHEIVKWRGVVRAAGITPLKN
jgi:tripartite-type tricarboxylate transporter receptor subunit TctC